VLTGVGGVLAFGMGLTLGLLGAGGSILTVPLLVYVLGVEPKEAISSSLFIVATTSVVALARHAPSGRVRWRVGLIFAAFSTVGAYVGGRAAEWVPAPVLLALLATVMLATGITMLAPARRAARPGRRPSRPAALAAEALVLGGFMGLVGAGGGFALVPALARLGGLSMHEAVATSLLVIALNALGGFAGHASHAGAAWTLTALLAAAAAAGAVTGGALTPRVPQDVLRRLFACLVLGLGVFVAVAQAPATLPAPWWPLGLAGVLAVAAMLCRRAFRPPAALGAP
jgi:uncharacterized membrane protein YfcA